MYLLRIAPLCTYSGGSSQGGAQKLVTAGRSKVCLAPGGFALSLWAPHSPSLGPGSRSCGPDVVTKPPKPGSQAAMGRGSLPDRPPGTPSLRARDHAWSPGLSPRPAARGRKLRGPGELPRAALAGLLP